MKNPALYPLIAICILFALTFAVWAYFAIKNAREHRRRAGLSEFERINEDLYRFLTAPRPPVKSAPMYRHHGHIHAKRPKNRADRRAVHCAVCVGTEKGCEWPTECNAARRAMMRGKS